GAAIDATAAAGLFSQEEDSQSPPASDGSTWHEQALEQAAAYTDPADEGKLYVAAAHAARDGLCTPQQASHVQNRIRQRGRQLQGVTVAEAEDLGRQAAGQAEPDPTTSGASSSAGAPASGSPQETAAPSPSSPGGSASTPGDDHHRKLIGAVQGHFKRLGFSDDDRAERLWAAGKLAGVKDLESLNDLDPDELAAVAGPLAKCKDRPALEAVLAAAGKPEGGDS